MTAHHAVHRRRNQAPRPITIGVAGFDGSVISWSREDETNLHGHGRFAGTPDVVDAATAILLARQPIVLPTGVTWHFPARDHIRVADVAAAMITALQVDADLTELLTRFPQLR